MNNLLHSLLHAIHCHGTSIHHLTLTSLGRIHYYFIDRGTETLTYHTVDEWQSWAVNPRNVMVTSKSSKFLFIVTPRTKSEICKILLFCFWLHFYFFFFEVASHHVPLFEINGVHHHAQLQDLDSA